MTSLGQFSDCISDLESQTSVLENQHGFGKLGTCSLFWYQTLLVVWVSNPLISSREVESPSTASVIFSETGSVSPLL